MAGSANSNNKNEADRKWWDSLRLRPFIDLPGLIGAVILLYETFFGVARTERPTLLYIGGALLGLPFVFRGDLLNKKQQQVNENDQ